MSSPQSNVDRSSSGAPAPGPDTELSSPWGVAHLHRWPTRRKEQLRAWDAADEHLLRLQSEGSEPLPRLLVNDAYGALAVPLLQSDPNAHLMTVTDSVISAAGLQANLARNQLSDDRVTVTRSVAESAAPSGDPYGRVFMKVPKSHGMLEDQLHQLRWLLGPGSVVHAGIMARHMQRSTLELFGSILGDAEASRAWRKSRVITAAFDPHLKPPPNAWPQRWSVETPDGPLHVVNQAGVFSSRRLDIGTRFLLDHLPVIEGDAAPQRVVDLGCGNGVVGEVMRRRLANAGGGEVILVDESHAAVASARLTLEENPGGGQAAVETKVVAAATLDDVVEPGSVDLVVNNPPFHEDRALGDASAWEMFQSAHRALAPGGTLTVVGNQHLRYHLKLQRIFGNVQVVGSDPKFVVVRSVR